MLGGRQDEPKSQSKSQSKPKKPAPLSAAAEQDGFDDDIPF